MFTAHVAVEDQDEIAQDSAFVLTHSQGAFCRVVDFRIDNTTPAVGLSRVPQKTTQTALQIKRYHMLLSCRTNPKKTTKQTRLVLVSARAAAKLLLRYRTEK